MTDIDNKIDELLDSELKDAKKQMVRINQLARIKLLRRPAREKTAEDSPLLTRVETQAKLRLGTAGLNQFLDAGLFTVIDRNGRGRGKRIFFLVNEVELFARTWDQDLLLDLMKQNAKMKIKVT